MRTQDLTPRTERDSRGGEFEPAADAAAVPTNRTASAAYSMPRGAGSAAATPPPLETGDFNLGLEAKATLRLLLRRRHAIGILTLVAVVGGGALTFVLPSVYESHVQLLPTGSDSGLSSMGLGQAAGVASTFGINLGAPSVAMAYPDMLKSRQIRERILDRTFRSSAGQQATLQELLHVSGSSPDERRANALAVLDRKVRIGTDKDTGVLELVVRAHDPLLAQQVAAAYVEEIVRIEDELRAATARTNKEFIEKRLTQTEATLRVTEDTFKNFQADNPHMGSDPDLQLQSVRLERDVRVQEEIYLTLVRQYELAKIDENRQSPGLQVIDPADRPLTRSSPILMKNLALSAFLGFITASLLMVGIDWWSSTRRQVGHTKSQDRLRPAWDVQVPS
jgi:uncharacterized protein involved in exopolysaccharide biosynthesis